MEEISFVYSKRKTLCLEVTKEGRVICRCPKHIKKERILEFLEKKADWIKEKQEEAMKRYKTAQLTPIDDAQLKELSSQAKEMLEKRVASYAAQMGVTYQKISVGHSKTRWGSCSSQGNLRFHCLLALCPSQVQDYLIVHELAHRKEMNHSPKFWKLVEEYAPDYLSSRRWLRIEGDLLISRMIQGKES